MGPHKKSLLKNFGMEQVERILPDSAVYDGPVAQRPARLEKIRRYRDTFVSAWEQFRGLWETFTKIKPSDEEIASFQDRATKFFKTYKSLDNVFDRKGCTNYIHALVSHVPRQLSRLRSIKWASCQGVHVNRRAHATYDVVVFLECWFSAIFLASLERFSCDAIVCV